MRNKWFLILIIIIFAPITSDVGADWRDRLGSFKDGVRNTTERVRDTTERVRSGTQKAKENWKQRERRCSECGKIIHIGTRCASCQAKAVRKKSRDFGERVKGRTSDIKKGWNKGRNKRKEIYNSIKQEYKQNLNRIRDPETRRKATETISTIVEIRRKIRETKKKGVNMGFDSLAKIPIGEITLGELASEKLSRKFPELGRTGLFDNPTEAATALVCHDSNFFLNEVNVIQKGDRNVSVYGAIRESSSFDANKTIKYLQIAGATEGVASADDIGGAMIGIFNAIDAASR